MFCSLSTLAEETGLSIKSIRVALTHLALTGEVAKETTRQGILLTLVGYAKFQDIGAHEGHTRGTQGANEGQTRGNDLRKKEFNNTPPYPPRGESGGGENPENPKNTENLQTPAGTKDNLFPELITQKEGSAKGQARGKREKKEKYFLALDEARSFIRNRVKDPSLAEVMAEWAKMRYAKRGEHRLTEKAINDTLKKLEGMGYTTVELATACYEQSINRLWDDVFELKARG